MNSEYKDKDASGNGAMAVAGAGVAAATGTGAGVMAGVEAGAGVGVGVGASAGSVKEKADTGMIRPYATLFILALVVALLARAGLMAMDLTGTISYDYISASNVPILDVICSILTGSAFVAFLFVSGLALVISTAGVALFALLFARRAERGAVRASALKAFLAGWATALVALICAIIVVLGILSAVQMGSMSSKLPSLPLLVVALVVFAAFLGTLLGAASLTLCACIARAQAAGKGLGRNLIVASILCGIPVTMLTVGTFAQINTASINLPTLGMWFGACLVVNVIIMIVGKLLVTRAANRVIAA